MGSHPVRGSGPQGQAAVVVAPDRRVSQRRDLAVGLKAYPDTDRGYGSPIRITGHLGPRLLLRLASRAWAPAPH